MPRSLGTPLPLPSLSTITLLLSSQSVAVQADELTRLPGQHQPFITRPDIFYPKWRTTVHDQDRLSPGYIFLSPYEHDAEATDVPGVWTAPMILDQHGGLIWSGAALTEGYKTFDFRVSNVQGQDMLTFLNPRNRSFVMLDRHYNISKEVEISPFNGTEINNMRELNFVDEGARALVFYDEIRNASKSISDEIGFNGTCLVMDSTFKEADPKQDWKFVYRWAAHKRIQLSESIKTEGTVDQRCNETVGGWDWVQTNSVDKFSDKGRYLLSARYTNTIYKLYRSGDVEWRLGANRSNFEADFSFSNQHHARIQSYNDTHTLISFVDNADPAKGVLGSSRGLLVSLRTDTQPRTANLLGEYWHPDGAGSYTPDGGSMQVLPDGNVFSGWVEQLKISEHDAEGKLLMEAHVEQDFLKSYRSYKLPWVGRPAQPPDVYAEATGEGVDRTIVYVSWNGATEVKSWNVLEADRNGKLLSDGRLGYAHRSGFETKIEVDGYAAYVVVDAVDKDGASLGRSNVFRTVATDSLSSETLTEGNQKADAIEDAPGGDKSWKQTAEETATSKSGMAGFVGLLAVIVLVVLAIRFWRRRSRTVRTTKKHNRKPSDQVLARYTSVPEVEYEDDDGYESGKG